MKREVAGAGARRHRGKGWVVGGERSFPRIETINLYFVQPEIGHKGQAALGVKINAVGVWPLLPPRIDAGSCMLDGGTRLLQRAIPSYGQHCHTPAAVVC